MTTRVDSERREEVAWTRTSLALWFGVIGGPAAALVSTIVAYSAVDRACVQNTSFVLHFLVLLFLVVAVIAGAMSWRLRDRIGELPSTAGGMLPRSHFMAELGILTATVACFGIILQWIPVFFLGACHGT
jgi:uncharacterized membrane protein YidH (DUF202 family)